MIKNKNNKSIMISIRISKDVKKWLKDNHLKPSKIFNNSLKEIGFKSKYKP